MIDFNGLKWTGSVCVFLRHGEKDPVDFGLTRKGKKESLTFARALGSLGRPVAVYTSPEDRCMETARLICRTLYRAEDVQVSTVLGKPGIQVKDGAAYDRLTDVMKCRDIFRGWKKGLYRDAMHGPETLGPDMLKFFQKTAYKDGIALYISQSGTVACTGYALGMADYGGDWVGYLDGYILRL